VPASAAVTDYRRNDSAADCICIEPLLTGSRQLKVTVPVDRRRPSSAQVPCAKLTTGTILLTAETERLLWTVYCLDD